MITIFLKGDIGDLFISQLTVAISTVAEAIACLKANFPEFNNYLFEAANRGVNYQIKVGYEEIEEHQLPCPINPKVKTITITSIPAGSGTVGKILLGAALLGTGIGMTVAGVGAVLGITAGSLILTGSVMLLSGIFSIFNKQDVQNKDEKNSSIFGGSPVTIKEGDRVPIVYGVALAGLYIVSAFITTTYQPG